MRSRRCKRVVHAYPLDNFSGKVNGCQCVSQKTCMKLIVTPRVIGICGLKEVIRVLIYTQFLLRLIILRVLLFSCAYIYNY